MRAGFKVIKLSSLLNLIPFFVLWFCSYVRVSLQHIYLPSCYLPFLTFDIDMRPTTSLSLHLLSFRAQLKSIPSHPCVTPHSSCLPLTWLYSACFLQRHPTSLFSLLHFDLQYCICIHTAFVTSCITCMPYILLKVFSVRFSRYACNSSAFACSHFKHTAVPRPG